MIRLSSLLFVFTSMMFLCIPAGYAQQNPVKRVILTWDFFKNDKPSETQNSMLVNGGIDFNYKPVKSTGVKYKLNSVIKLKLDTSRSYVDFTRKYKDTTLLHFQQGMLDIAAIYANKLQDTLNTTTVSLSDYHLKAKNIYDTIGKQLLEKQKAYQLETGFGTDTLMQKKWDLYFKSTLRFE